MVRQYRHHPNSAMRTQGGIDAHTLENLDLDFGASDAKNQMKTNQRFENTGENSQIMTSQKLPTPTRIGLSI